MLVDISPLAGKEGDREASKVGTFVEAACRHFAAVSCTYWCLLLMSTLAVAHGRLDLFQR